MTSHIQSNDQFWVTCTITIDCGTLAISAVDEHHACDQARALYASNPQLFHQEMTPRIAFEASYAPLDEGA